MVKSEEAACQPESLALVPRTSQQLPFRASSDDWTGITSSATRRKLQNRLNQRAYRARKRAEYRLTATAAEAQSIPPEKAEGYALVLRPATEVVKAEPTYANTYRGYELYPPSPARQRIAALAREAYESYLLGAHRPSQLHLLLKLNVLDAAARNATLLGFHPDSLCVDEMISTFSLSGPVRPDAGYTQFPKFLQPTFTQTSVVHHPFIDLFPFPIMRDRALRGMESGLLDEDELCYDLLEVDEDKSRDVCLIVWGESSDPAGWEATERFLEKYGWLVWGCTELFEATNQWRARRGERPLLV